MNHLIGRQFLALGALANPTAASLDGRLIEPTWSRAVRSRFLSDSVWSPLCECRYRHLSVPPAFQLPAGDYASNNLSQHDVGTRCASATACGIAPATKPSHSTAPHTC